VHTVGEYVLIRGRWVSIPKITTALARIDGVSRWELRISREGTLDAAALHVTFKRDTLVGNPMWKSRIGQCLVAVTPVTIEVVVEPEVSETARPGAITDLRGQHLGLDRAHAC
jgi:phenylacetate-CoA ligase